MSSILWINKNVSRASVFPRPLYKKKPKCIHSQAQTLGTLWDALRSAPFPIMFMCVSYSLGRTETDVFRKQYLNPTKWLAGSRA
jgi:hypothetical protein